MALDPEKEQTLHQAEENNRIYIYPMVLRHSDRQIRARFANVAAVRRELWRHLYLPDLLKANDADMFVLVRDCFLNDTFWREALSNG